MAKSEQLRKLHEDMQLNNTSKKEDKQIADTVNKLVLDLEKEFGVNLVWEKKIFLTSVIKDLKKKFPDVSFADPEVDKSFMTPDGGITYMIDKDDNKYPILIGEVKTREPMLSA